MKPQQFQLRDESIDLHRLLKLQGICSSGGAAKFLVASGAVRVDGTVELRKACKIHAGQRVQTGEIEIEVLPPLAAPG